MGETPKTVLICGGGFAGLAAAKELIKRTDAKNVRITVLDSSVFHTYHAWLYEVATFAVEHDISREHLRDAVCLPTDMLERYFPQDTVHFMREVIVDIDFKTKTVRTAEGHVYTGDVLVFALGSVTNNFDIPGITEHAYELKETEHALAIHEKIQELFRNVQAGAKDCRVVVGGGGYTGVELASELANYIRHMERKHHLPEGRIHVEIVEAQNGILQGLPAHVQRIAVARLKKLGIKLWLGKRITRVTYDRFALEDGTQHRHDMFIWGGGIKPSPVLDRIQGIQRDKKGRLIVDQNLMVPDMPGVFAVGDSAAYTPPGKEYAMPQTGQAAHIEGVAVADNILRYLTTQPLKPVKINLLGYVIPLGGRYAIAALPGLTFAGLLGFMVRRFADFRYLYGILPFWDAVRFFCSGTRLFMKND